MQKLEPSECQACGSDNVTVIFVSKYRGFRGDCANCGSNWPES